MEKKFYVGQKVKIINNGSTYTTYDRKFTELGFSDKKHNPCFLNGEYGVIFATTTHEVNKDFLLAIRADDGRECLINSDGVCLIDPEPFRLTEWQRKQLEKYTNSTGMTVMPLDRLESILSEPEPPEYQPKNGDAVLVRNNPTSGWIARVSTGEEYWTYNYDSAILGWKYCRPFNPDLVGKVTD